MFEKARFR